MATLAFEAWLVLLAGMTLLWMVSVRRQDASLVDRVWGLAFVAAAAWWFGAAHGASWSARSAVALALVTVWGVRLSWHIHARNRGHAEDQRYAAMRARAPGVFWWRSLVTVFWLQATLALIIGLPHLFIQADGGATPWGLFDWLGVTLWTIGFGFEAIGDAQLRRFKSDPGNRGKLLTTGLWGLTRHPNYFGDACVWWGFAVMACSVPGGVWTLPCAALMTFFLLKVSGVPLLERAMRERPGFAEYAARTPVFFPRLWPRRGVPSRKT
jgi:steroid 5-alpha reductase family enzyme